MNAYDLYERLFRALGGKPTDDEPIGNEPLDGRLLLSIFSGGVVGYLGARLLGAPQSAIAFCVVLSSILGIILFLVCCTPIDDELGPKEKEF